MPTPKDRARRERDRLLLRLLALGHSLAELAVTFGLSTRQVDRVRRAGPGPGPPPRLTAVELRGLRKEYREDPASLAWLDALRIDRRRRDRPERAG